MIPIVSDLHHKFSTKTSVLFIDNIIYVSIFSFPDVVKADILTKFHQQCYHHL